MDLEPIKLKSQFMRLNNDTSIDRLKTLIGKDVYVDIKEKEGICSFFYKLSNIRDSKIIFDGDISYDLNDIKAIEEVKNYNEKKFDFDKLLNKSIILTDMHNNFENVVIGDYDDKFVYLYFLFENNDGNICETKDYEFPICFIKNIKEETIKE